MDPPEDDPAHAGAIRTGDPARSVERMARRTIPLPPGWPGFAIAVGLAALVFVVGPLWMALGGPGGDSAAARSPAIAFACAAAGCGALSTIGIATLYVPHRTDPPRGRPTWALRASTRRGGRWARFLVPAGLALLGVVSFAWSTWFVTTTGTELTSVAAEGVARGGGRVEYPVWVIQVCAGVATLGAAAIAVVYWPLRRRWRQDAAAAPHGDGSLGGPSP